MFDLILMLIRCVFGDVWNGLRLLCLHPSCYGFDVDVVLSFSDTVCDGNIVLSSSELLWSWYEYCCVFRYGLWWGHRSFFIKIAFGLMWMLLCLQVGFVISSEFEIGLIWLLLCLRVIKVCDGTSPFLHQSWNGFDVDVAVSSFNYGLWWDIALSSSELIWVWCGFCFVFRLWFVRGRRCCFASNSFDVDVALHSEVCLLLRFWWGRCYVFITHLINADVVVSSGIIVLNVILVLMSQCVQTYGCHDLCSFFDGAGDGGRGVSVSSKTGSPSSN